MYNRDFAIYHFPHYIYFLSLELSLIQWRIVGGHIPFAILRLIYWHKSNNYLNSSDFIPFWQFAQLPIHK